MKAKTYYIHPERLVSDTAGVKLKSRKPHVLQLWSRTDYPVMGVKVPIFVLPASALPKVIERAVRAMYAAEYVGTKLSYAKALKVVPNTIERLRRSARAAYQAGGFL